MPSPLRVGLVAALAIGCHAALAQTAVPPAVTVQRAAPQLVAFAGSQSNFQNLVTGLAQGTQVQLFTILPDGSTQIVTFTPAAPVPMAQIPALLETARQQLIGLGIGNPTAEQIATTLMGGMVPTAFGGTQVGGTLNSQGNPQNPPSPAVQAQANAAVGASAAVTPNTPGVSVQTLPGTNTNTTSASPPVNTSDSPIPPGATSRSPTPSTPTATGLPGPESTATPSAPGERPSGIQGAPVRSTAPALSGSTAQPGNTNSALRAR